MTAGLLVVVLAGGEGRRMGGDKGARVLAGRSLLDHALARARQWSEEPVVTIAADRASPCIAAPAIRDRPGIAGPLGGLAAGHDEARRAGADRVLIVPADMPLLPDDLSARLGAALVRSPAAGCAVARSDGQDHPVCSLWRVDPLGAEIDAYAATGDRSLRGLAQRLGAVEVAWTVADGCDPFFNVNTPADLALAEALLARAD